MIASDDRIASGTSAHQFARHPSATVSSPADQRPDEIGESGARTPDPERTATALRREAAHRPGEGGGADEARPGPLNDPAGTSTVMLADSAPNRAPTANTAIPISATLRALTAVDQPPGGDEDDRVGKEVCAEDDRGRGARDVRGCGRRTATRP